jgi:hypothetical protein
MDHIGWQVAGGLIVMFIGAVVGRFTVVKPDCSKCGLDLLKAEIGRLCNLVRVLCEKTGIPVKDQLEIENME